MSVLFKKISAKLSVPVFFVFAGCMSPVAKSLSVSPLHFNIQIPFQTDNKGIIISTYWGSNKKEYKLYLDNHSPSWINDAVLKSNRSISKSKDFLYSTTTADGEKIHGDVYICDNMNISVLNFKNVVFYNISNETNAGKTDGAIGENIMRQGIWKIDFRNNMITFASSLDSIQGLQETQSLHAIFTEKAIEIEVTFSNSLKKKFDLDIGYNGCIIMPANEFESIAGSGKHVDRMPKKFSTPAGEGTIVNSVVADSIWTGNYYWGGRFGEFISTNAMVKEKLIGMGFFKQFEFLVIDYRNKAVYLSRTRRIEIPAAK